MVNSNDPLEQKRTERLINVNSNDPLEHPHHILVLVHLDQLSSFIKQLTKNPQTVLPFKQLQKYES